MLNKLKLFSNKTDVCIQHRREIPIEGYIWQKQNTNNSPNEKQRNWRRQCHKCRRQTALGARCVVTL